MPKKFNLYVWDSFFFPTPRVYTDGLSYAEVITKFSGIDRFPFSFTHEAPLHVLCTHVHSTIK